ncbi:MAG: L,D-transpeptidase family protein [Leptolyngbyaceae cyanobacterium RU_5_1]|nr:L,D-transpeptidase family protein [Leptolyngbyaceae cyanobacterium RU_5_1]
MLHRPVTLTSLLIAIGLITSPFSAQAGVYLEPEPPTPDNLPLSTPVQPEVLSAPTVQPVTPETLEFELPSSREPNPKPLYSDEQPLRLEIKLSRRRVTLYRGNTTVKTYAIAVGRPGWETPTGTFKVQQMFKNPTWVHPLQKGISIPGGDPENPLGRYWIGFWTDGKNWIGFHGTPNPKSVGTAASHGCIRMYNTDIEDLFKKVSLGVEVKVVR